MKKLNLLPRWTRFFGLAMIIPCLFLFVRDPEIIFGEETFNIFGEPKGGLAVKVFALFDQTANPESGQFQLYSWIMNDLGNEIMLTLMLFGTYLVAFAKVKDEDEFSSRLRLEAMTQAIVYNSILLLLLNWLFYEGLFLYVLVSQLFSFLLIFSLVFALKIRNHRKMLANEE